MPKRQKFIIFSMIVLAVVLLSWVTIEQLQLPVQERASPQRGSPAVATPTSQPSAKLDAKDLETLNSLKRIAIPKPISGEGGSDGQVQNLPPAPPLPAVPPQYNQKQRREAFQLKESVDHIVLKDEPFEVNGKKITIAEIEGRVKGKAEQVELLPAIRESDVGGVIRKPVAGISAPPAQAPSYYGVRVVRPGENIWNIHYAIVREYFARRHVSLPMIADEPAPDGRSSGIGRLLKFIEGVVYVYNIQQNRLESDLNVVHPYGILIFFKISDLFAALDQLKPADLPRLRYVNNSLQVQGPAETRDLLDRRALLE